MAFDLDRFVTAQRDVYAQALAELAEGRKRSHWMWFVFPQLAGLGRSETARFYAIVSAGEARAYLAHPLLGPRLRDCTGAMLRHRDCTGAMLRHRDRGAESILGAVDAIKFRSSMTLFDAVAADRGLFGEALQVFYGGERDGATLELLAG